MADLPAPETGPVECWALARLAASWESDGMIQILSRMLLGGRDGGAAAGASSRRGGAGGRVTARWYDGRARGGGGGWAEVVERKGTDERREEVTGGTPRTQERISLTGARPGPRSSQPGAGEWLPVSSKVSVSSATFARLPFFTGFRCSCGAVRPFNTRTTAPGALSRSPISARPAESAAQTSPGTRSRRTAGRRRCNAAAVASRALVPASPVSPPSPSRLPVASRTPCPATNNGPWPDPDARPRWTIY